MQPNGHIKLDRKILSWEWYSNSNMVHVFIHLLLTANHKEGHFEGMVIKRGQLVTGRIKLALATGLSEMQVRTCLAKLKKTKEITVKSTKKNSLITICKYNSYQYYKGGYSQPDDFVDPVTPPPPYVAPPVTPAPVDEKTIIGKMKKVWYSYNPSYQIEENNDYPALLKIAYKIAKVKGYTPAEVVNGKLEQTIVSWDKIVQFIHTDDFYKKLELTTIEKKWTGLCQTMLATKESSKMAEPAKIKIIRD